MAIGSGGEIASGVRFAVVVAAGMGMLAILAFTMIYCIQTVLYYDLRVRKEGFDLELLESSLGPA